MFNIHPRSAGMWSGVGRDLSLKVLNRIAGALKFPSTFSQNRRAAFGLR